MITSTTDIHIIDVTPTPLGKGDNGIRGRLETLATFTPLLIVVLASILAPALAFHDPVVIDLVNASAPPTFSSGHLFGTDELGRDVFSRVLYGGRTALLVSFVGAVLATVIGLGLAVAATALPSRTDQLISRFADLQLAVPSLILAIIITTFSGTGTGQMVLIVVLGAWILPFRISRSVLRVTLALPYIEASRMSKLSFTSIVRHHLIPAVLPQMIVSLSVAFSASVLLVSSLGYLGLGVQPPAPDWGQMIASAQGQIGLAWWAAVFPGLAIVLTAIGAQLAGDMIAARFTLSQRKRVH